jgi:hypothetical protein
VFVCGSIILTDSTQQNSSSRKLSRRIWSLCSAHIRLNLNRFGFLFFLFFEPMRKQVEAWQRSELTDVTAKVVIYEAFVEGKLETPKHLARTVHDLYFEPKYEEFRPRTIWSLSNAFTSAFKELEPIPQFKATAKLGEFLENRFAQSF